MRPFELVRYCPRCGHLSTKITPAVPFHCSHCGLNLFFGPTVSASAFIMRDDGRILLIRRAKEPASGKLGTVGGFVDAGESAEDALRREIKEEVHLDLKVIDFLASYPNDYVFDGITYPVVDLFFVCLVEDALMTQAGEDVAAFEWHKVSEVPVEELAFNSMKQALLILKRKTSA